MGLNEQPLTRMNQDKLWTGKSLEELPAEEVKEIILSKLVSHERKQ